MADTGRTVWADGLWADGFWAAGLWAADEPVAVPDVDDAGTSQAAAVAAIEGAGLIAQVLTAYSSTIPAGEVISQEPAAGTLVAPGSTVTITVSLGVAPVTDQPSGGWYMDWRDLQELRRRKKKRREEREKELAELAEEVAEGKLSEVDGEIAEFLRIQEAKDEARKERDRLRQVAQSARQAALSDRVREAAIAAALNATHKNLDRFEQALKRHMEEEELAVLLALMMDD